MSLYAQFGYPLPVTQPVTKVLLADGSYGTIEKVRDIHYNSPQTTYNFEVEDFHTYYVTESAVLVHNDCDKPISPKKLSNSEIKKFSAHDLKYSELCNSAKISQYDIYKDVANKNRIWINNKSKNTWIDTGYLIDDLPLYFPPKG